MKEIVPHGDWLMWVESTLSVSQWTCTRLMRYAKQCADGRELSYGDFVKEISNRAVLHDRATDSQPLTDAQPEPSPEFKPKGVTAEEMISLRPQITKREIVQDLEIRWDALKKDTAGAIESGVISQAEADAITNQGITHDVESESVTIESTPESANVQTVEPSNEPTKAQRDILYKYIRDHIIEEQIQTELLSVNLSLPFEDLRRMAEKLSATVLSIEIGCAPITAGPPLTPHHDAKVSL
jgi:hypothetical protein